MCKCANNTRLSDIRILIIVIICLLLKHLLVQEYAKTLIYLYMLNDLDRELYTEIVSAQNGKHIHIPNDIVKKIQWTAFQM